MVVITENITNGKWFPLKDKKFRFGHISFKLIVIKLTERQISGTTGGREDRLGAEKGLKTTSGTVVRDIEQPSGRQTTDKRQTDRQTQSCQGCPVNTHSKARVEKVKQQ